jgi:hypothetical protein
MSARTAADPPASAGPLTGRQARNASNSRMAQTRRCTLDQVSVPVSRPVLQCHCAPARSHPVVIWPNRTVYRPIGSCSRSGIRPSSTGSQSSRRHHCPVSRATARRPAMRASRLRRFRAVVGAGSCPVRRCTACAICRDHSGTGRSSSETGTWPPRPSSQSAMTSPTRRASMFTAGTETVPPISMTRNRHQAISSRIRAGSGDRPTSWPGPPWRIALAYRGGRADGEKRGCRISPGSTACKDASDGRSPPGPGPTAACPFPPLTSTLPPDRRRTAQSASPP